MKISKVELKSFKRFTHLTVENIPETAKLIVLVGPNGSGKTSFFEAFHFWQRRRAWNEAGDQVYFKKNDSVLLNLQQWHGLGANYVDIQFHHFSFNGSNIGSNQVARGLFYFRSAYRNDPDFTISALAKQDDPRSRDRLNNLMQTDVTVSSNYQRLIANSIAGLYNGDNGEKLVAELRDELIGKIRLSLSNIFEDLNLSSIGKDVLSDGSFYFEKGTTKDFHYKNLSAGEKSAFDLILDMVIKSAYYDNSVYCIDEPESHMHTALQGKVLRELYSLTPDNSQLWISTHSIGMLEEAEAIEKQNPGTVIFLDFGGQDFDDEVIISPTKITKALLDKFYELAFGSFAKLVLPKTIVFCEGTIQGRKNPDFDKQVYTTIFQDKYPKVQFISANSCGEIVNLDNTLGDVMKTIINNSKVIKIIDRDDRSDTEISELNAKGINVLKKRHLECYLLDDEIIIKLVHERGTHTNENDEEQLVQKCLQAKQQALQDSVNRGYPNDDIKSASRDIFKSLKTILGIKQCGNATHAFLRDTIAPLITEDTDVYKELEKEIFTNSLKLHNN
jgi:predicted ATPase